MVVSPRRSCHAVICGLPGGRLPISKLPSASGTVNHGWLNTTTEAAMCEWMSQNTLTMPALSNLTARDSPRGKRPRLKVRARESEKTL
jgi:hypothetical protein